MIINNKNKKRKEAGITLIEIIMASFVFSLVITITSGIFMTNYGLQRKTHAAQTVLAETSYSIEYMSRLLRMARKDVDGVCTGAGFENHTYVYLKNNGVITGVRFLDYNGNCVDFYYGEGSIWVNKRFNNNVIINNARIISPLVIVSNFGIYLRVNPVTGTPGPTSDLYRKQPSVTISFNARDNIQTGINEDRRFDINIQTTVTRRGLDVR